MMPVDILFQPKQPPEIFEGKVPLNHVCHEYSYLARSLIKGNPFWYIASHTGEYEDIQWIGISTGKVPSEVRLKYLLLT